MNGTASNTSGAEVVNLGYLPLASLPLVVDNLKAQQAALQRVIDGDDDMIALDFAEKTGGDCIPNTRMAEIARRLVATIAKGLESFVINSATEPDDHTKAWQPIDPVTKIPVGSYKIWNNETQKWEVAVPGTSVAEYVPPAERFGRVYSGPGISTQNFQFEDMKTTNYFVFLTPTTQFNGAFLPAPSTFPNSFGYVLVSKSNADCTFTFYGIPNLGSSGNPIGLTWEVRILELPTS